MIKCLVKHCQNHIHQGGGFHLHYSPTDEPSGVGPATPVRAAWICMPCWATLVSGTDESSPNFSNMVLRLIGEDAHNRFVRKRGQGAEVAARLRNLASRMTLLATDASQTLDGGA